MEAHLPRNRATNFVPENYIDLNQTFLVPMKSVPLDGLHALKQQKTSNLADLNIPSYNDGDSSPDGEEESKEIMYKNVASVPIDEPDLVYMHLLQLTQSYEAMAPNQKIVAFTNNMPVRKAFYGLIYNSTRTGLVVDYKTLNIIGVLSVSDFIMVLMKLWKFQEQVTDTKLTPRVLADVIGCMPISKWKEHQKLEGNHREFITTDVSQSLYHAVEILTSHRIHRLPVMDRETNDCMFIITHRRILHFLWNYCLLLPKPTYMFHSVSELRVGCWEKIKYVSMNERLIDTLDMMIADGISGVPVVEQETMKVMDVYTRFDAIAVAFNGNFERMDMSVSEAIEERTALFGARGRDSVVTVGECASLWQVLEVFIEKNVHRIFAVDETNKLKAVISLSDMISYMVLRPAKQRKISKESNGLQTEQ